MGAEVAIRSALQDDRIRVAHAGPQVRRGDGWDVEAYVHVIPEHLPPERWAGWRDRDALERFCPTVARRYENGHWEAQQDEWLPTDLSRELDALQRVG